MAYYFSDKHATRAERFFSTQLRYVEGEKAGQPFVLEPWQATIVRDLFGWLREDGTRRYRIAYIEIPRKNGKALDITTPIATPDGWKRHGDLVPGDFVFGPDGLPKMVQAVTGHYAGPCCNVRFGDGSVIVAHENHEWETRRTWYTGRRRGSRCGLPLVTTSQIRDTLTTPSGESVHSIGVAESIQCESAVLPVAPYTFGIWLGDGHSDQAKITTADQEVISAISADGMPIKKASAKYLYSMATGRTQADRNVSVQSKLRSLGVIGNKHIPTLYLRAAAWQRIEVLAGLVDSDGHVTQRGQCEITLTSERLSADTAELCRTLGYKPTVTESRATLRGRDIGPRWRIQFWPGPELPLRIPRKRERLLSRRFSRSRNRVIVGCDTAGERIVNCIQVEGGMYLAGESMIPTHNSTFAAGLALYLLLCDGEERPQVYSCAADRDQASIVFRAAREMIEGGTAQLQDAAELWQYRITGKRKGGWYEAASADAKKGHGRSPHGVIFDELHTQPNRELWDSMLSGRGARRQPLVVAITTAGHDRSSICWEMHQRAEAAIRDPNSDPTFYGVIYGAAEDDDWTDETVWAKANPNLGVSVSLEFLREECVAAQNNPAHENVFRNLYLNQWTQQAVRWIPIAQWDACEEPGLSLDDFEGEPCWAGLDLAATRDINALTLVFRRDDVLYAFPRFWMPQEPIDIRAKQDRAQAKRWAELGNIKQTDGNVTDYGVIAADVMEIAERFQLQKLAYDPWGPARSWAQVLTGLGFDAGLLCEFRQTIGMFASPSKEFERRIAAGTLKHAGCPVMRWMVGNAASEIDKSGNVRPSKSKSGDKIDGVVSTIMALGLAIVDGGGPSVYETEGSLSI